MTRILIVRHGETDWNAASRVQGHENIALNEAGRRQVRAAARALSGEPVSAVYSSDLTRAEESGRIVAEPHGLAVEVSPCLRERNWGNWEGRTMTEIEETDAATVALQRAGKWVNPAMSEEFEALRDRVVGEVRRIAEAHAGETVIIATHGGPVKVFACWVLGAPIGAHGALRTGNAGITTVIVRGGRYVLESYNVTSHLRMPVETASDNAY